MNTILRILFGCSHRNYTFPQSSPTGDYVCCLECGAEFEYDWAEMRVTGERKQQDQETTLAYREWLEDAEEIVSVMKLDADFLWSVKVKY